MENVGSMSFLIRPQSVVWLPYGQDTACCFAGFVTAGSPGSLVDAGGHTGLVSEMFYSNNSQLQCS